MYFLVVTTDKDIFRRHCPVRGGGSQVGNKVTKDIVFLLDYKNSANADFSVALHFQGSGNCFVVFSMRLSFCIACGRFIGFGNAFDVCWICKGELE